MMHVAELAPEALRWRCDPATLGFSSTDEVPPLTTTIGQERGVGAIELALALETSEHNLFVAGPSGTGRGTTVREQVTKVAATRPAPSDWCYLHNFDDPYRPVAVELPSGKGAELAHDLDDLVAGIRHEVPKVFESDDYSRRRAALLDTLRERRTAVFGQLGAVAESLGHAIEVTPTGVVTVPMLSPGKPLTTEAFALLPDKKRQQYEANGLRLKGLVAEALLTVRRLEREAHEAMHALDRQVALFAIGHLLDDLRKKYATSEAILRHVDAVQEDVIEHLDAFREAETPAPMLPFLSTPAATEHYRANVLVGGGGRDGAPVVFEANPSYYNLQGRIDYEASFGGMRTDFTLIKPGALHRANGGFLILRARDLLTSPYAWEALKRALREGEIRIESLGEQLSILPTAALKPAAVPLRVRVILVGDLFTYLLLFHLDEDFPTLFRLRADFAGDMPRTGESVRGYAAFVSGRVRARGLVPFSSDGVARIVEHGARIAEHRERLSARLDAIEDLVVRAAQLARAEAAERVSAAHVERALAAQERRANLVEEQLQRLIDEGTIAIDVTSSVVGQVNALSVLELGDYAFARPSRVTARVGIGSDGVVNVEREVELSRPTHSKGVLILGGYLLGAYGQERPLALSARLGFEQTYGEVEGDSASAAELFALLSALADVPIAQGIAVTGSVDQRGDVQAVGGVTRKIEGHYAVCAARGLTGTQGVIIPAANVRHLMLKPEVAEAVARGAFHVWPIRNVDEGIELLTGVPAGARGVDGSYAPGTVHAMVRARLAGFATRLAEFVRPPALAALVKAGPDGDGHGSPAARSGDARKK